MKLNLVSMKVSDNFLLMLFLGINHNSNQTNVSVENFFGIEFWNGIFEKMI